MGYYISINTGLYYEGDKQWYLDTEVTQRPYVYCTWNGSSWDYVLADCQVAQKRDIANAIDAYIDAIVSAYAVSRNEGYGGCWAAAEIRYLADNPGASDATLPLLAGYAAQMGGGATKANAAADIDDSTGPTLLGKVMRHKKDLFAQIDAETDGYAVTQIVFDENDLV